VAVFSVDPNEIILCIQVKALAWMVYRGLSYSNIAYIILEYRPQVSSIKEEQS
jgi:hypothetical protein